jgi:hypothetical protein
MPAAVISAAARSRSVPAPAALPSVRPSLVQDDRSYRLTHRSCFFPVSGPNGPKQGAFYPILLTVTSQFCGKTA